MNCTILLAEIINQAVLAVVGFGFAYLGFCLLASNPPERQHAVQLTPHSFMKRINQLPRGCWFALFGAMIVLVCMIHGLWVDRFELLNVASGESITSTTSSSQSSTTSNLLGGGMLLTTAVLVILTGWYAWSTHRYTAYVQKQFRLQTDPCVIAFTQPNSERGWGIDIVIKNFGQGIAKDVSFERSNRVDEGTWTDFLHAKGTATPMSRTVVVEGIPVLPPGGTVVIPWDHGGFALRPGLRMVCKYKRMGQESDSEFSSNECFLDPLPGKIQTEERAAGSTEPHSVP